MSEEDFQAQIESWRLIASEKIEVKSPEVPGKTAMTASADDQKKPEGRDALRSYHELVLSGANLKQI
jgi:hypothetical protein